MLNHVATCFRQQPSPQKDKWRYQLEVPCWRVFRFTDHILIYVTHCTGVHYLLYNLLKITMYKPYIWLTSSDTLYYWSQVCYIFWDLNFISYCIRCGPDDERILDIVAGGTELGTQIKTGSRAGRTRSLNNPPFECTGVLLCVIRE